MGLGFALVVVCWAWPKRSPAEPKAERLGRSEGEGQQTAEERPFINNPAVIRHFDKTANPKFLGLEAIGD